MLNVRIGKWVSEQHVLDAGCPLILDQGLYTSPHLVAVRERIRINGAPIYESTFVKYFYEVWDRLQQTAEVCHRQGSLSKDAHNCI